MVKFAPHYVFTFFTRSFSRGYPSCFHIFLRRQQFALTGAPFFLRALQLKTAIMTVLITNFKLHFSSRSTPQTTSLSIYVTLNLIRTCKYPLLLLMVTKLFLFNADRKLLKCLRRDGCVFSSAWKRLYPPYIKLKSAYFDGVMRHLTANN